MAVNCSSTAGVGGPSFAFSGTAGGAPNLRTGVYTLAVRVRWSTTSTSVDLFSCGLAVSTSDGSGAYIQRVNGDPSTTLEFYRTNTAGTTIQAATMTGGYGSTTAWHHVAMTYDGTNITPYLDGVAGTAVASATTTCTSAVAGYIQLCGPASGDFADAVFFSRALTAIEIAQLARERLPINRRTDCFGWYPMFSSGTLADCGRDFSGRRNDAAIVNSGTGNPVSSNAAVPATWGGRSNRIIYIPTSALDLGVTAGTTQTTGSVTLGELAAITPAGTTQTTGAVTLGAIKAITPAGTTNTTGSVTLGELAAVQPAGTTNVTGSVTLTQLAALATAGTTTTFGSVTFGAAAGATGAPTTLERRWSAVTGLRRAVRR